MRDMRPPKRARPGAGSHSSRETATVAEADNTRRVGLAETERTTYKTKDKIVPTSSRLASPRLGLAVVVEALVVRDLGGPLPGGDVEGRHERMERLGPAQLVLDRVQHGRGLRL